MDYRDSAWFNLLVGFSLAALVLAFILSAIGCTTMEYATIRDHKDLMDECRAMCGDGNVKKYRPRSGECECVEQRGVKVIDSPMNEVNTGKLINRGTL